MRIPVPRLLAFLFVVAAVSVSACGGGGSGSSSGGSGGGPGYPAKILSWTAPSAFTDNTTLNPAADLANFEIYVKETGNFTDSDAPMALVAALDPVTHLPVTSFDLANLGSYLSAGVRYQVSVRAVALTGAKSEFSSAASFSF